MKSEATSTLNESAQALISARASLAAYATVQNPQYQLAPHIDILIDHLEAMERGEIENLMVFMPPRHSKSETCTKLFPSWWIGKHPDQLVILSSYSQELVEDFAQDCREFIKSEFHCAVFPECAIDESSSARHDFRTTRKGGVRSVGKGGSITGRGGDLIVLDDVIKDKEEARSEAEQRKLRQWFNTTILNRRSPTAHMLLIMTRWDPEDIAGWQLETFPKSWKVLELPAISERDEGWRSEGAALWPERYSLEWLEDMRDRIPRDDWLALYQQRPTRDGDERVFLDKWYQLYSPRSDHADTKLMNGEIIVDPANKKNKKSDRTAMWVIGMAADRHYYFVDGVCDRLGLKERWVTIKALHKKWAPNFRRLRVWWEEFGMISDREYIEEKQNAEAYRFYIERIGSTRIAKQDLIKNFGRGICQDMRVHFNAKIPSTVEGVRVNLTEWFYDHEWSKYPALRHEDLLNAAAYITDPKIGTDFPAGTKGGDIKEMLDRWKKRHERITPFGV